MDSGFYAAVAGLVSRVDSLNLLANNLANSGTTGYKAQHEFYQALSAASDTGLSSLNQAVNNYGLMGGAAIDFSNGSIESTGNQLDLALEGSGFLVAQTAAGIRYTRNGSLHLGAKGELLTPEGDQVLGVPPTPAGKPVAITLPEGEISISPDGTISNDGGIVAQLKLVAFAHGSVVQAEGGSYFSAPANAEQPAPDLTVHQGALEGSNYDPVRGTVDLVTVQRNFELMSRALTIFDTDFTQTAVRDLPRVQ